MTQNTGKAIFITGAASGIGRAAAQLFGQRGWFVGLADVNEAGMAETAALLPAHASSIHRLDVRDYAQWEAALAAFTSRTDGRLDAMFNNAGVGIGGPLSDNSLDDIAMLTDINFRGVIYGARAAFPWLGKTPGSCLVNTGSASGIYGASGLSVYSATKFGVRGLTEALDVEWAAQDIRVRSIMPGFIDTPLLDYIGGSTNMSSREKVIRSGLEFTPVEVVAQAVWDHVNGGKPLHSYIGKTARRLAFGARWMPGRLRKQLLQLNLGRR